MKIVCYDQQYKPCKTFGNYYGTPCIGGYTVHQGMSICINQMSVMSYIPKLLDLITPIAEFSVLPAQPEARFSVQRLSISFGKIGLWCEISVRRSRKHNSPYHSEKLSSCRRSQSHAYYAQLSLSLIRFLRGKRIVFLDLNQISLVLPVQE